MKYAWNLDIQSTHDHYIYTHDWNHIPVYIGFIHLNVEFARRYFTENEIGYIVRIWWNVTIWHPALRQAHVEKSVHTVGGVIPTKPRENCANAKKRRLQKQPFGFHKQFVVYWPTHFMWGRVQAKKKWNGSQFVTGPSSSQCMDWPCQARLGWRYFLGSYSQPQCCVLESAGL